MASKKSNIAYSISSYNLCLGFHAPIKYFIVFAYLVSWHRLYLRQNRLQIKTCECGIKTNESLKQTQTHKYKTVDT